jgi:hypothetical protein
MFVPTLSPNTPRSRWLKLLTLVAATLTVAPQAVLAQQQAQQQNCNLAGAPVATMKDPLINGAYAAPAFIQATPGQPPAYGDGPTPGPVAPGMGGEPTNLPWIPAIPSNQIDKNSSGIPIPISPAVAMPPGVLGPLLTPFIPGSPSTPGPDPGNLLAPMGYQNPAADIYINPEGGIPGQGGWCTTIPTNRRGGQQTHQWELRGRNSSLGGIPDDGSQDEVELLGPMSGYGMPFGVPTGDGLRESSLDLGGGQRFKTGGQVLSTGGTVQDYGLSATRDNSLAALSSRQSTEFGQGWRRIPRYSSNTTDYGFPYTQFNPANVTPQKHGQLLLPRAVITNF